MIFIDVSIFSFLVFLYFSSFSNSKLRCSTEGYELLRLESICPNLANTGNNLINETIYNDSIGSTFSTCDSDIKIINIKTVATKITSKEELGIAWIKLIFRLAFSKIRMAKT